MNKIGLLILFFWVFDVLGQQGKAKPTLENLRKRHSYVQSKDYKGPATDSYSNPSDMNDGVDESEDATANGGGGTISYSPEEIERARKNKQKNQGRNRQAPSGSGQEGTGTGGRGSGGSKSADPEMGMPEPIEYDSEDNSSNDVDIDPIEPPLISPAVWKAIFVILLIAAVIFIAYIIVKNYRPRDRKLPAAFTPEELNPEEITKTELERRLEEAMQRGDYRECVRIYFTFILKEMIRLKRIRWKKDLTNRDYVNQARAFEGAWLFEETVRIYDLVWYGEYAIEKTHYQLIEGHLRNYYQQLTKQDA